MENKIKVGSCFIDINKNEIPKAQDFINLFGDKYIENQVNAMTYFAKMHIQEALKEASEVLECYPSEREQILKSYPLENIK